MPQRIAVFAIFLFLETILGVVGQYMAVFHRQLLAWAKRPKRRDLDFPDSYR